MKLRYAPSIDPGPRVRTPCTVEGAMTLAGSVGLWFGAGAVGAFLLRTAGSVAAAALLTGMPAAGRSLQQALRRVRFPSG